MGKFFKGPFDFDGDGTLDPFELATEFMIFEECTKEDDEDDFDVEESDWDDGDEDEDE